MQRKIDKAQAILNLRQEAHKRVLKDEVMKFRLEARTLEQLLSLSQKLNKPAGANVREWVIEKLSEQKQERTGSPAVMAISIIATSLAKRGILHDDQIANIQQLLAQDTPRASNALYEFPENSYFYSWFHSCARRPASRLASLKQASAIRLHQFVNHRQGFFPDRQITDKVGKALRYCSNLIDCFRRSSLGNTSFACQLQ